MEHQYVIEDEAHAEHLGTHSTLASAIAELERLAKVPWDRAPNVAPCQSWRTCGRRYEILEYNVATGALIRRMPALEVSSRGAAWSEARPMSESSQADVDVLRIDGWIWSHGGHGHEGWLPQGAATPLPTRRMDLRVNLEIQVEATQAFLLWQLADPSESLPGTDLRGSDSWHENLDDALSHAEAHFGVPRTSWRREQRKREVRGV